MYRRFAGVVIPDNDELAVLYDPMQYGEDEQYTTVLRSQHYGAEDGITSGDEGLGVVQAARLKAKLGRSTRRLDVGRRGFAVAAGTRYDYGFGVAPLVAVAAAGKGVSVIKRLTTVPAAKKAQKSVGALVAEVKQGNVAALQEMHRMARQAATVAAKVVFYYEMEKLAKAGVLTPGPEWRGQSAAVQAGALIRPGQFEFRSQPGALTPPSTHPVTPPSPWLPQPMKPQPAPGPTTDAGGGVTPWLPQVPSPIPPSGGGPTPTEDIATGTQPREPVQAGMFGGIDFKSPGVLLTLAGIAAVFVAPMLTGKGGRSRRRRR